MLSIREEYRADGLSEADEMIVRTRQFAVSDYLSEIGEKGRKGQLTKDDRKFVLDLIDENSKMRSEHIADAGKKIDALQEEIAAGKVNNTELLKDNPKIVKAIAHEFVMKTENSESVHKFDSLTNNLQEMTLAFSNIEFDQDELNYSVEGTNYNPNRLAPGGSANELINKHEWKQCYEVFKGRNDGSVDKIALYNDYVNDTDSKAKNKYKIGLGINDGKLEISTLPPDVMKIKESDKQELQAYRNQMMSERGALLAAKEAVAPISGWAERTLQALDAAHPLTGDESEAYTDMRDTLEGLKEIDSGSVITSATIKLNKLIETTKLFEQENTGLFSDSTLTALSQKMRSFAECKLPELSELREKSNCTTFISEGLSNHDETIRRIDKEAELRGIILDKKEDMSFTPEPDRRIETVSSLLENAKKGVRFGSKEYENASKSFTEAANAFRSFRELGDNASSEQRMNAIEAYHEAANKAMSDMNKYMVYRQAKGPMENNRDVKTQRRIDAMTAAINTIRDTNSFMDDRYSEITKKVLKDENIKKFQEENEKIMKFRLDMDKDPSYMKYIVKGANDAMDKLDDLASGKKDVPLTPQELNDAKKAMATITLYTTIQHARKNDKSFELPITEDLLEPMTNKILNQTAFQKATEDINTREQLRNVLVDPDALRVKYTLAGVAEKQQQRQGAERLSNRNEPLINNDLNRQGRKLGGD